ncbi:hypothetical protein [Lutispora sp.]|uniref:hypothetical protein n=1 Tax=Lutispora sp. TaxID=2828727 RepID=UPI0035630691
MDHVVYVDAKSNELEELITGRKTMILRGATGRKLPYGRVNIGDMLYFINNDGEGKVRAKGNVTDVYNSDKMAEDESISLVEKNQDKLRLTEKQFNKWAGKRYIVLIQVGNVDAIEPFRIDKSNYGNMDDWLPVENIDSVRL